MTKKAFTLLELMIIVAIIIVITAIAIPNVLKARMTANDVMAQATLKTIGKAMESYYLITGLYPTDPVQLTGANPPYLNENYFGETRGGFGYSQLMDPGYYTITATPVEIGRTGTMSYTVTTGGDFQ